MEVKQCFAAAMAGTSKHPSENSQEHLPLPVLLVTELGECEKEKHVRMKYSARYVRFLSCMVKKHPP